MTLHSNIEVWDIDIEKIQREAKEFADRIFGNFMLFMNALVADAKDAADLLRETDSGFTRRTYLRSFFSFVEGVLFARRIIVYEYTKDEADSPVSNVLSDAERMLLQEIEYTMDDNGSVKVRAQNFQPFLKFLRFTFAVASKHGRKPNSVDYAGVGWAWFRVAHEVRNRITHPKSPEDLAINDSELDHVKATVKWFVESLDKI
jgi:hypothetical protein